MNADCCIEMQRLFDGLGCRTGNFVALQGYFDDSGDGGQKKIAAIGGVVGFTDQWTRFDKRWKRVMKEVSGCFHATDCESGQGKFKGWTVRKRNEVMERAVSAIISCGLRCVGIYVNIGEYRGVFSGTNAPEPYSLIFSHAVALAAMFGAQAPAMGQSSDTYIWHEGGSRDGKINEIFRQFRDLTEWPLSQILQAFAIGRKNFSAVQAADLVARETFKYADNLGSGRNVRIPVKRLIEHITFFPWTKECLERLKSYGWPSGPMALIRCMTDNPPAGIMPRWPR
ncbi:MAG TPA: hypothetical protein VMD30_13095 [Tepidisphaeraceae bacterium]|nr:hypothetical protein [Tepidisphaeraceae bacterium]